MSQQRSCRHLLALVVAAALCIAVLPAAASAQGLEDVGGASWRLQQPAPPPPPPGVAEAPVAVGLGRIGDIEFAPGMPNRGVLIASGNPPTVPAGVWEFNGVSWHLLASVCGASDGRIVWAGPEEFWTISDGRPGQAPGPNNEQAPIRDDTLCRFSNPGHNGEPLRVMESFAAPAFEADSYQPLTAGACFSAEDCWFAGAALPKQSVTAGSFHLHWDGSSLSEEPYPGEGHAVESMQRFEGRLYEGVRIRESDRSETSEEPALHTISPAGSEPVFDKVAELPLYEAGEFPAALDFLHLSAGEELLWGAAGPQSTPAGSNPAQVTIVRDAGGGWVQVVGPAHTPAPEAQPFEGETPTTMAAEPGSEDAWIGLDSPGDYDLATSETPGDEPSVGEVARVARVSANGAISSEDEQSLPSAESGIGPKGAAFTMTCPAVHDCWLATTRGWLFHLSTAGEQAEEEAGASADHDPAFETEISERPADRGLPVTTPDTLPPDTSGLLGEITKPPPPLETKSTPEESRVTLPLLSRIHSRVVHGHTLELRFHLAVKARLKLLAKRGKRLVASTPLRTLAAGNRSLMLRLNPKRWPTKLQLESHPLAPLPTVSINRSNETTVSTSLRFPNLQTGHLPTLLP
jgi:hypothetical protein